MIFAQIQLDPCTPWGKHAQVFDSTELLCRLGDDRQVAVEVVETFLNDYRAMMHDIRDAVASRDAARLEDGAHELLGTIGHFETSSAYESARRIEEMGKVNDMDGAALAAALKDFVSPPVRS
jgi:Hpt domain